MEQKKDKLSREQVEGIVKSFAYDTFISAAAGSGKTRLIAERIAYMFDRGLAEPKDLLVLSFTAKSAMELKGRIYKIAKHEKMKEITVGTFHKCLHKILRSDKNLKRLGISAMGSIRIRDARAFIKKTLVGLGCEEVSDDDVSALLDGIEKNKSFLRSPLTVYKLLKKAAGGVASGISKDDMLKYKVYKEYVAHFLELNQFDFADILYYMEFLLRTNDSFRSEMQEKWKFIMVDEAQDSNLAQIQILMHLSCVDNNTMLIGDARQAIYGFRGSQPKFMIEHKRFFKDSQMLHLTKNFRSSKPIVDATNSLIANTRYAELKRINKDSIPHNMEGCPVIVQRYRDEKEEARQIISKIKHAHEVGVPWEEIGVISRRSSILTPIIKLAEKEGIPYIKSGEKKFWDCPIIKSLASFYLLCDDPSTDRNLYEVLSLAGFSSNKIKKVKEFYKESANIDSYIEAIRKFNDKSTKDIRDKLIKILKVCLDAPVLDSLRVICQEYDVLSLINDNDAVSSDNMNLLIELVRRNDYDLWDFVEHIEHRRGEDVSIKKAKAISFMTIHAVKGLEYDLVFVPGVEQDVIPDYRSKLNKELEEDRRILYVAMTRAKKKLCMSYVRSRKIGSGKGSSNKAKPSEFLEDIGSYKFIDIKKNR